MGHVGHWPVCMARNLVGNSLLARRALSLVVTRRPQVYENMIALTGVERVKRRAPSVHYSASC
jgi:hypothetical protein